MLYTREGIRIRVNTVQSESGWEGTEFTICPKCKQVVRREEIERNMHVCWNPKEVISQVILA
ncbi:MAG: hypothetical protein QMD36_06030 [Candidatus Aenigmarchaeota archaeon]|nr:hypothetical protein [Candidatus Aenigmarchaeota archaeon]